MISLKSLRHLRKALGVTTTLNWHVEDHETLEQAVRREAKVETNLDFRPDRFVVWFEEIFPKHRFHAVALAFAVAGSGALQKQPDEVSEMAWLSLADRRFLVRFWAMFFR